MLSTTWANSSGVEAAVRFGAAATRTPVSRATPNDAASSGTLPSFTRLWTVPTRSKENHPTRLAASVSTTAPPTAR